MKNFLLCFLIGFAFTAVSAQVTISVDPAFAVGSGPATSSDIGTHAQVTNTSADTIWLLWSRTIVSMEHDWTTWVCDQNNCYLPSVDVCPDSRPNKLAPGTSMNLEVHVGPAGVDGNAEILIHFFVLGEPETILGTLEAHLETSTSSVLDINGSSLRIFPNPTTSYFQINNTENVHSVAVYNMVGNKMREFDARTQSRFNVYDLPAGVYLVRILNANQQVLRTVRLSKR